MKKAAHIVLIIIVLAMATIVFADNFTLFEKITTGAGTAIKTAGSFGSWTCEVTTNTVVDNVTVAFQGSLSGVTYGDIKEYVLTADDLMLKKAFFSVFGVPVAYIRGNLIYNPDNATVKMTCLGSN